MSDSEDFLDAMWNDGLWDEEPEEPDEPDEPDEQKEPSTPPPAIPATPTVKRVSTDELRHLIELDYTILRNFNRHMFEDEQMIRAILRYNGVHPDTLKSIIKNIKDAVREKYVIYTTVNIDRGEGFSIWTSSDIIDLQDERMRVQNLIEDVKQLDPNIGQSICQNDLYRLCLSEIVGNFIQDERLDKILKLINTRGIHQKLEDLERNETPPDFKHTNDPPPVYRLFDILKKKIKLRL
jgi:hypothetical protein